MVVNYKTTSKDDFEFLFELYKSSRMDEVSAWGWEKDQILPFLQMQFNIQQSSYELQYPNLESRMIVFENEKVGRLLLAEMENRVVIVDITLLPDFQSKGIGTEVISSLLLNAKKQNKCVRLSVFHNNAQAKKLYERLGFKQISMNEMYVQMEWS